MAQRPTLQTVATAAGVSRSTVSNAYARPDQLSPALRQRILDIARDLGYSGPDPTARSLRRGRAGAIGVLFTSNLSYAVTDPFAIRFLRGVAAATEQRDTSLLLIPLPADRTVALRALDNAAVDGFCIYCGSDTHWALAAIRARGLPIVASSPLDDAGPAEHHVGIDEAAASAQLGDHLAGLGHRRIGVVADGVNATARPTAPVELAGPEQAHYLSTRGRLVGIRDAFATVGVPWSQLAVISATGNDRRDGRTAAALLLDQPAPPTAILALTDVLALGVLDELAARGLRPGVDVSVTGFDDIDQADAAGLTTIRQPAEDKGRIAAELLLDPPAASDRRQILLPTELITRTSTGPAPRR
ncbi:LacI family DNA-binding transcriptional regulator [Micromonospora sp. NBC_01813]|uniref:LacI family DNA-binding transcriptional regulator n=1 Tax=Micromonospora sp. NBC_01813 TaxID=2975988 RepID=UPI002DDACA69|nr:LacI family DNA-binding transcriptional regulator [Micromonospora sp. NBC_01813]WSA10263.1 LacI family DNA-binding transcriptional regulator [Micromonospora sp. NBC_01813]